MRRRILAIAFATTTLATAAYAQSVFSGKLVGFQETPAVVSAGSGQVKLVISDDQQSISYELTYSGLEGSTVAGGKVLAAHIHVGQRNVAGGVSVFFCGGGKSTVTQAACPAAAVGSDTIKGTWTAADVVGPTAQGIDPSNPNNENAFARLIAAIKAGRTYANVHSTRSPGGEIRGQIGRNGEDDEDAHH
jgi:hypothetical protein